MGEKCRSVVWVHGRIASVSCLTVWAIWPVDIQSHMDLGGNSLVHNAADAEADTGTCPEVFGYKSVCVSSVACVSVFVVVWCVHCVRFGQTKEIDSINILGKSVNIRQQGINYAANQLVTLWYIWRKVSLQRNNTLNNARAPIYIAHNFHLFLANSNYGDVNLSYFWHWVADACMILCIIRIGSKGHKDRRLSFSVIAMFSYIFLRTMLRRNRVWIYCVLFGSCFRFVCICRTWAVFFYIKWNNGLFLAPNYSAV